MTRKKDMSNKSEVKNATVSKDDKGNLLLKILPQEDPKIDDQKLERLIADFLEQNPDKYSRKVHELLQQEIEYERREKEFLRSIIPWLMTVIGIFVSALFTTLVGYFVIHRQLLETKLENHEIKYHGNAIKVKDFE